ncbi:unnamed protein product [Malus baccata var. baccata]
MNRRSDNRTLRGLQMPKEICPTRVTGVNKGLRVPKKICPIGGKNFKREIFSTAELSMDCNCQMRSFSEEMYPKRKPKFLSGIIYCQRRLAELN